MKKFSKIYSVIAASLTLSVLPMHAMETLRSGMASAEQTTQEFIEAHPRITQTWHTIENKVGSLKRCLFEGGCSKKKIAAVITGIIIGLYALARVAAPARAIGKSIWYVPKQAGEIMKRGAAQALMPYQVGQKVIYEEYEYTVAIARRGSKEITIHPVKRGKGIRQEISTQNPNLKRAE